MKRSNKALVNFFAQVPALLCGLCLAVFAVAGAEAKDLPQISLESSVLFALHSNPDLMISLEQEKQAGYAVDEARSAYYPQLSADAKTGREFNDPTATSGSDGGESTNSWQLRLIASQLLYDGKQTHEEVARRKSLVKSARVQNNISAEKVLNDTISSYVNVWRFQRAAAEGREFVRVVQDVRDKVQLLSLQGAESKAKIEYADSRLAAAHSEVNSSLSGLSTALGDLEALTGRLPPFLAVRPSQFDPTVRDIERYYTMAVGNNRSLLNDADREAVEHQEKSQEGSFMPNLSLQAEGRRNSDVGGDVGETNFGSLMLVMNYKLFDGGARKAASQRLQSQVQEYKYRQDKINRDTHRGIQLAYNQLIAAKEDYANVQDEIISSEALQNLYQKQFAQGEGDVINLIEGQERLHAARLKSFKIEADLIIDGYGLLRQVGALRKEDFCASC